MNQLERKFGCISDYRNAVLDIEDIIKQSQGAMEGDCFPLKHTFTPGIYVREITMPAGAFLTSKIHKTEHPYFVLRGRVRVYTEDGMQDIVAPYSGITKAGTKRILHIIEDTVWITIHATDKTDVADIEKDIIAKDFKEIDKTFVREIHHDETTGGLL